MTLQSSSDIKFKIIIYNMFIGFVEDLQILYFQLNFEKDFPHILKSKIVRF